MMTGLPVRHQQRGGREDPSRAEGEIWGGQSCFYQVKMLGTGLSVLYRDISRKQYIASFGNIRKYRDTGGYRDIFMIFFYALY